MASEIPKRPIPQIKHILLVTSGKGGVGKSTCALYLASAFARAGLKTAFLDADIHGPSATLLAGLDPNQQAEVKDGKLAPIRVQNIDFMSISFLIDRDQPLIWRGPMLSKILQEMLYQTQWGDQDILIIDCPPGTGDIHLTLCQQLPLEGSVIISTASALSILDVEKNIAMLKKLSVPVLGLIQNMAYFHCSHCEETSPFFDEQQLDTLLENEKIEKLATLPFDHQIQTQTDSRNLLMAKNDAIDSKFDAIIARILPFSLKD